MTHPKFVQIVASSTETSCRLFALTEDGEVWFYSAIKQKWFVVDGVM